MNKLLLIVLSSIFMLGCAAQEEVKPFHPTDDIAAQAQGDKGFTAEDTSVVELEPPKPFHPTDDISSQAQGGKGETSDGSEAQLP